MQPCVDAPGCDPAQRYTPHMFTKPVLVALLAACGVPSTESPTEQPEKRPPDEIEKDYIFCCQDVDPKNKTGEGCVTIGEKQIDQCSTVLACADGFTKKDGAVTCT
jgi:hypothetical protein